MILLVTPTPAITASEMSPARLLSIMPDTTARPLRNMEDEPILTTLETMSRLGKKLRMDSRSMLRRVI